MSNNTRCLFLSFSGAVHGLREGKLQREDLHQALYWLGCDIGMISLPFVEALRHMGPWFLGCLDMRDGGCADVPHFRFVRKQLRRAHAEGRVVWRARYSDVRLEPIDDFLGRFGYPPTMPVFEEYQAISRRNLGYTYGRSEAGRAEVVFESARERYEDLRIFGQLARRLNG